MKLLLIDGDTKLIASLSHLLKKNGFVVDSAPNGEAGLEMVCTGVYDIIVLERVLPRKDGLAILREFRDLGYETPVLFLTTKGAPEERAEGLNAGADDYVSKPYFAVELLARLQALTRRRSKDLVEKLLVTEDLILDPMRNQVKKGEQTIQLTLKEAQLLELLIRNQDRVVTKDRIVQTVWGFNAEAEFTTVNLYVHYLRKKLNINNLKTVRGVGYYLQSNKTPQAATH